MEKPSQKPTETPSNPSKDPLDKEKQLKTKMNAFFDEFYLNSFQRTMAETFLTQHIFEDKQLKCSRVRSWFLSKLNKKRVQGDERQRGCPDLIPNLRAKPFWDTSDFPWIAEFEERHEEIKEELMRLRADSGFQPYRGPAWSGGEKAKDGVGYNRYQSLQNNNIS